MAFSRHSTASPPSSPLSVLSQSPSPPSPAMDVSNRYPSPSSSAGTSGSSTPRKSYGMQDLPGEIRVRTDGPPPTKRRRVTAPRPRTTEYVDLENHGDEDQENLHRLLTALRKKKKIVVIAGAGISVSAGIPDFRSSTGLFTTLRGQHKLKASGKHLFDASVYKHDSSTTSFHDMVRELSQMASDAKPTPFHHMLASIAAEGRLMRLYTQNIDSLDTQMPPLATNVPLNSKGPWPTTIQLHGGLGKMVCTKCSHLETFNPSLFQGPEPPLCEKCKEQDEVRTAFAGKRSHGIGKLRPRIVLYNEYNPDEDAIGMVSKADLRRVPDAVIVVGTTLKIPGVRRLVKELCQLTRSKRDGITAWINLDPEPQGVEFKDCWDLVIKAKCDDVAELVNLPRWDQQDIGDRESYMVTGDELKEKRYTANLESNRIDILLKRKRKRTADGEDGFKSSQSSQPSQSSQSSQEVHTPSNRKSKIAEQGGMPTPIASPKLHNALLPAARGRGRPPKQSTLSFGTAKAKEPAPASQKAALKRKPNQPKKTAPKATNRINQTFKATKAAVSAPVKETKTPRKQFSDPDSSDLSSPPDESPGGLPSLRPKGIVHRPAPLVLPAAAFTSSPPTTPTAQEFAAPAMKTVSPGSKPRSMGHLID